MRFLLKFFLVLGAIWGMAFFASCWPLLMANGEHLGTVCGPLDQMHKTLFLAPAGETAKARTDTGFYLRAMAQDMASSMTYLPDPIWTARPSGWRHVLVDLGSIQKGPTLRLHLEYSFTSQCWDVLKVERSPLRRAPF